MAKQSLSLHLDGFRDHLRPPEDREFKGVFSSRKQRPVSRYSVNQQLMHDFRSASNTHRDFKREFEPVYQTARYYQSKKPSIAYIDSEEDPDFLTSLNEYIHNLNVEPKEEKQNNMGHYPRKPERLVALESKYRKQKMDNALLAKKIYSKRKRLEENNNVILQLQQKINNLIRESQRLKFQNRQEEQKNQELKEMIMRKESFNRNEESTNLHYRRSSMLSDLEHEREAFEQGVYQNRQIFYK